MTASVLAAVRPDAVTDFATAADAALRDLRQRVGLDGWLVVRRDGADCVVLAVVDDVFGITPDTVAPWEETICARMLDGTAPMAAPDVERLPLDVSMRWLNSTRIRSYLSVPITAPDGEVLGALCAAGLETRTDALADLLPTVQVQAGMLGMLLSHELRLIDDARRLERAGDSTSLDQVTGVANRSAWDASIAEEDARARRYASSVSILVVDLEQLRKRNETSGHEAGDELLKRAAALLRSTVRDADLLARLAGGEFGILLPLTDAAGASLLADHLRVVLTEAGIGASVGAAARHRDAGLGQAWHAADAAMRADKIERAAQRIDAPTDEAGTRSILDAGDVRARRSSADDDAASVPAQPATIEDLVAAVASVTAADQAVTPVPDPSARRGTGSVDALLRLARDQLGMDVAFLSVFEGDNRRIRNAQSLIDLPIGPGFVEPSARSHCRLIADGRVAEVSPDAMAVPAFAALPVTAALDIHAFVGVPIHRRNGELYGTLCAFSQRVDETLHDRDAGVLRSIGEIAMDLVEAEDRDDTNRHELIARLDRVYTSGGPQTVFQPVVTLDGLEVVGYEALSRFPGSARNPAQWFADAASGGLGAELELRAVANAVAQLPRIPGFLALNVSPATVLTPGFARQVGPLPLDRLVLELTEHEPIRDYDSLLAVLRPLRALGLRIAVDDAGAGFASMAHILALVPDLIKLDISLVRGIDRDLGRQALAAALTAFAVKTNAHVIAEGVETETELVFLRELGIHYGQGYHLGRPGPLPTGEIRT